MAIQLLPQTRMSLLCLLQNSRAKRKGAKTVAPAWEEFHAIYYPVIHSWCRKFGLQEADADDVSQGVVLKLFKAALKSYCPESGRFRSWLRTVVQNAVKDFLRGRECRPEVVEHSQLEGLQSVASLAALLDELDQALPAEFELYQEIVRRVQARVKPRTWQVFTRKALERSSAAEVAQELGVSETSVYVIVNRIIKMLREEKNRIETGTNGKGE